MLKQHLNSLLDAFSLSIEEEILRDNQWNSLKKKLVYQYSQRVHQAFLPLLAPECNQEIPMLSWIMIQQRLDSFWQEVTGTILCYTAIPEAEVTQFLIHLTCEFFRINAKNHALSVLNVIQALMPSLL